MVNLRFNQLVCLTLLAVVTALVIACAGPQAATHESWTLVQLLTQDERIESNTEIIDVRNCGSVEQKTIECSAGTSNDFSVSVGGSAGWSLGADLTIDSSVANGLGFERSSGESLQLESPAEGYVNRFTVTKEYRILSGKVQARSSTGEEQDGVYAFQASCALRIESMKRLTCDQAGTSRPSPVPPTSPPEGPTAAPDPTQLSPTATPEPTEDLSGRVIPSPTPSPPPTIGPPVLQEVGQFQLGDASGDATSIATDSRGDIYVGVHGFGSNDRNGIYKYAPDGTPLGYIPSDVGDFGRLGVMDVTVDRAGNIYASLNLSSVGIGVWSPDGSFLRQIENPSRTVSFAERIVVDSEGYLFLFESGRGIALLDPNGLLVGDWEVYLALDPQPVLTLDDQVCWLASTRTIWCMSHRTAPHQFGSETAQGVILLPTPSGRLVIVEHRGAKMYVVDADGKLYFESDLEGEFANLKDATAGGQNRVYALKTTSAGVYQLNLP